MYRCVTRNISCLKFGHVYTNRLRHPSANVAMNSSSSPSSEYQDYNFGPWKIHSTEVFLTTPLSFAFVNLKPVVPGHVLVSSKRTVPRFTDLSPEEASDIWLVAQRVGTAIQEHYEATSLTFAIQDGPEAGQTVPHVHIHILPRRPGDFEKNDEIYDAIDESSKEAVNELSSIEKTGEPLDLDKARKPRTQAEMSQEAAQLRALFV